MDQTLLGETTAKLMDYIENDHRVSDGTITAVGIVAIVVNQDGTMSFSRTMCSEDTYHHQLGLFHTAVQAVADSQINEDS